MNAINISSWWDQRKGEACRFVHTDDSRPCGVGFYPLSQSCNFFKCGTLCIRLSKLSAYDTHYG